MKHVLAESVGDFRIGPARVLFAQPDFFGLPGGGEHLRHEMQLLLRREPTERGDLRGMQWLNGVVRRFHR